MAPLPFSAERDWKGRKYQSNNLFEPRQAGVHARSCPNRLENMTKNHPSTDVSHFLLFLLEYEMGKQSWPFSERAVTEKDPAILGFRGVALAWQAG
jgi:hypothetical protein